MCLLAGVEAWHKAAKQVDRGRVPILVAAFRLPQQPVLPSIVALRLWWRPAIPPAGCAPRRPPVKLLALAASLVACVAAGVVLDMLVLAAAAQHPRPLRHDVEEPLAAALACFAPAARAGAPGVAGAGGGRGGCAAAGRQAAALAFLPRGCWPARAPLTPRAPPACAPCVGGRRGSGSLTGWGCTRAGSPGTPRPGAWGPAWRWRARRRRPSGLLLVVVCGGQADVIGGDQGVWLISTTVPAPRAPNYAQDPSGRP